MKRLLPVGLLAALALTACCYSTPADLAAQMCAVPGTTASTELVEALSVEPGVSDAEAMLLLLDAGCE